MVMPSLAMVAATMAFCSGVTATSRCPMLDMPSAAPSLIRPTVDSATCSGMGAGGESRPNDLGGRTCSLSRAGVEAQLDEGGVAGPGERLAQRGGRAAAAGRAAVVLQRGGAVGQRDARRRGQLGVRGAAGLQRGRGGDHLERRARRVGLDDGAVDQRAVRVVAQLRARWRSARRRRGWPAGWGRRTVTTPWPGSCRWRAPAPPQRPCRGRRSRAAWRPRRPAAPAGCTVVSTLPPRGSRPVKKSASRLAEQPLVGAVEHGDPRPAPARCWSSPASRSR